MRLTRAADYAVRGMLYLASHNGRRRVLVSEIAEAEKLSPSFLAKIFQQLRKSGLVSSHRGTRGGFRLRVAPKYIRLREIIEAAQGSVGVEGPSNASSKKKGESDSPLAPICEKIDAQIIDLLDGTHLSDLIARHKEG